MSSGFYIRVLLELWEEVVWVDVLTTVVLLCIGRYFAEFDPTEDERVLGLELEDIP